MRLVNRADNMYRGKQVPSTPLKSNIGYPACLAWAHNGGQVVVDVDERVAVYRDECNNPAFTGMKMTNPRKMENKKELMRLRRMMDLKRQNTVKIQDSIFNEKGPLLPNAVSTEV